MGRLSNVCLFLLITVLITASSQILTPNNVAEGLKFTIVCDANKVTIPDPNIQDILGLFIFRTTSQDNNKQIASYILNPPPGVKPNGTDLPGRNYTFTPSGAETGTGNRATMKIQLDINGALCSDAGEYRCEAQYYYGMYKVASYSQNLTAETGFTNLPLKPDPDFETIEVPKESLYPEGTDVTLTCSFFGPNNTKVSWRYSTYDPSDLSNSQPYPTANDISDSNPVLQPGSTGCPRYYIASVLKPSEISKTFKTTYYCIISDGRNQQLASDNYTIGITGKAQVAITTSSSSDIGPIVGGIVAGIVVIVIVAVIVYITRRKDPPVLKYRLSSLLNGSSKEGQTADPYHMESDQTSSPYVEIVDVQSDKADASYENEVQIIDSQTSSQYEEITTVPDNSSNSGTRTIPDNSRISDITNTTKAQPYSAYIELDETPGSAGTRDYMELKDETPGPAGTRDYANQGYQVSHAGIRNQEIQVSHVGTRDQDHQMSKAEVVQYENFLPPL